MTQMAAGVGRSELKLSRGQVRASKAWERVQGVVARGGLPASGGKPGSASAEYLAFAKRFPALLHASGLCQAVAFLQAKAQDSAAHRWYLDDLAAVMGQQGPKALTERVRKAPLGEYLLLTREAAASAGWLARYAETLLGKTGPGEVDAGVAGGDGS